MRENFNSVIMNVNLLTVPNRSLSLWPNLGAQTTERTCDLRGASRVMKRLRALSRLSELCHGEVS